MDGRALWNPDMAKHSKRKRKTGKKSKAGARRRMPGRSAASIARKGATRKNLAMSASPLPLNP